MAEAFAQKLVRNGVTTPSTVAGYLTATTTTDFVGMGGFGLRVTTAIPAEIVVDPDDKIGFVVMVSNSSTFATATLTLSAGQRWQGASKAFTIGAAGSSANLMYFLGPFESAKYVRYDSTTITGGSGTPHVTFTLTTGTGAAPLCDIVAFKLPTVEYDT